MATTSAFCLNLDHRFPGSQSMKSSHLLYICDSRTHRLAWDDMLKTCAINRRFIKRCCTGEAEEKGTVHEFKKINDSHIIYTDWAVIWKCFQIMHIFKWLRKQTVPQSRSSTREGTFARPCRRRLWDLKFMFLVFILQGKHMPSILRYLNVSSVEWCIHFSYTIVTFSFFLKKYTDCFKSRSGEYLEPSLIDSWFSNWQIGWLVNCIRCL